MDSVGGVNISSSLCSNARIPPKPITPSTGGVTIIETNSTFTGYREVRSLDCFDGLRAASGMGDTQFISGTTNTLEKVGMAEVFSELAAISISKVIGFFAFFRSTSISCLAEVEDGSLMRGTAFASDRELDRSVFGDLRPRASIFTSQLQQKGNNDIQSLYRSINTVVFGHTLSRVLTLRFLLLYTWAYHCLTTIRMFPYLFASCPSLPEPFHH
jgi:hypothetical protein